MTDQPPKRIMLSTTFDPDSNFFAFPLPGKPLKPNKGGKGSRIKVSPGRRHMKRID